MPYVFNPFTGNLDAIDTTTTVVFDVNSGSGTINADINKTYLVNTSGGVATINLPAPIANGYVVIKDSGFNANTNNITVVRDGSEDIEGVAASFVMDSDGQSIILVSDSTDWFIV